MHDFIKKEELLTEEQNRSDASKTIPLIEERLTIEVQQVETGIVQLHKKVVSEEVVQEVPVTIEEIQVERKPINEYISAAPPVRYEGNTTIISVVKEVLVVEKRLMLVEEIHLTKKQTTTSTTIHETLRKEEIEITRTDTSPENITTQQ